MQTGKNLTLINNITMKKIKLKNPLPTKEELMNDIRKTYSYEELVELVACYALESEDKPISEVKKIAISQEAFEQHFRIIGADGRGRKKKAE